MADSLIVFENSAGVLLGGAYVPTGWSQAPGYEDQLGYMVHSTGAGDLAQDVDRQGLTPGRLHDHHRVHACFAPNDVGERSAAECGLKVCRAASSAPLSRQAGGWCSEALDQFEAGFDLADHVTEADRTLVSIGERVGCCSLVRHTGCPSPYALLGL